MPYNTTAIPPRKEPTGQAQLPLSRVKKIIAHDPDVSSCSNNAAFVITLATEMFIQHLTEEAHAQAKLERKPRRNIQYKDVANAVSRQDNLEFLEDVVPKTVPYRKVKGLAAMVRQQPELVVDERPSTAQSASQANSGTTTANSTLLLDDEVSVAGRAVLGSDEVDDPTRQLQMEMRQAAGGGGRDDDVDMTG